MFSHETHIRVRYGETDQMGAVYYGNYSLYYETARTEAIRSLGMSYKELEDSGIMMPVVEMHIKYILPASYDDHLRITTEIRDLPTTRMLFHYKIHNQRDELINLGDTTLAFIKMDVLKPTRPPEWLVERLKPFFES